LNPTILLSPPRAQVRNLLTSFFSWHLFSPLSLEALMLRISSMSSNAMFTKNHPRKAVEVDTLRYENGFTLTIQGLVAKRL